MRTGWLRGHRVSQLLCMLDPARHLRLSNRAIRTCQRMMDEGERQSSTQKPTFTAGAEPVGIRSARDLGEHSYMAYFEVDDVTGLHTDLAARVPRWSRSFEQSHGACGSSESRPSTVT